MSSGIYRKEISDYVTELKEKKEKLKLENALDFNSFERKDQHAILWIYKTKAVQQELKAPIEDKIAGIEETARLYRAQKCAFQDVLTEKGFEPTEEILQNYSGRIAILTEHGTFITMGKYKQKGRIITMKRIHSPELSYDKRRGFLDRDLKLDKNPYIRVLPDSNYKGSRAIALALNDHGSDDDELEEKEAHKTQFFMGLKTAFFLTQPRELVGAKSDEE
jgi:hypothetical protein